MLNILMMSHAHTVNLDLSSYFHLFFPLFSINLSSSTEHRHQPHSTWNFGGHQVVLGKREKEITIGRVSVRKGLIARVLSQYTSGTITGCDERVTYRVLLTL